MISKKNAKGITLISLIVYIMVMLIVIAILSTVSTTFYKNMKTIIKVNIKHIMVQKNINENR